MHVLRFYYVCSKYVTIHLAWDNDILQWQEWWMVWVSEGKPLVSFRFFAFLISWGMSRLEWQAGWFRGWLSDVPRTWDGESVTDEHINLILYSVHYLRWRSVVSLSSLSSILNNSISLISSDYESDCKKPSTISHWLTTSTPARQASTNQTIKIMLCTHWPITSQDRHASASASYMISDVTCSVDVTVSNVSIETNIQ